MKTEVKNYHQNIKKSAVRFLLLAYGFTWLVWLPGVLATRGIIAGIPWPPLFAIGACGPLVAALCLTRRDGGKGGIRAWLRSGFLTRIKLAWWLLILLVPFLIPPLALWLDRLAGGDHAPLLFLEQPGAILSAMLIMLTIGGAQEEYGWRGYLLPKLDQILKPWQSDILMIILHVCWHIPLFAIAYTVQYQYSFWLFLAFGAGLTPLIDRIYRATGSSILAALVFHGLINTGLEIFPPVGPAVSGSSLPLLLIAGMLGLLAAVISLLSPLPNTTEKKDH